MKDAVFTPEQKEEFQGCYLISDARMAPIGDPIELTVENFKAFWINDDKILQELNAEDFRWYDPEEGDFDFKFTDGIDYVERNSMPVKVAEFLDAVIKERMNAESE